MKLLALLVLATMAGGLSAQDMRTPVGHSAFAVHPYIARNMTRGDLATSRFWTPVTIALVSIDGAAKAADSLATRRNIDGGGEEYNPLARPFVHTTVVQVAATAALFGAEIATAYALHRRRHNNFGRAILVGGAVMNWLGAASSYRHRVVGW